MSIISVRDSENNRRKRNAKKKATTTTTKLTKTVKRKGDRSYSQRVRAK